MFANVNVKNMQGERVSPTTHAKNVFENNGLNLEEHLELIYKAIGKTDIKRLYLEINQITDKVNPTTYELVSAMADNTIALISLQNPHTLIEEIGARASGIMVLVKKTSVYFSCGMFFTYRYGETFTGVAGLAGQSFVWHKNTRPIHSLHSGATTKITTVNTYEKISNWGGIGTNPKLSIESKGTIRIPDGVNHIMVSAYIVFENATSGTKYMQIFKNDSETNIMVKENISTNGTLSMTPIMLEVNEGDTIDLRVYSNSLDTLRFKHLTIEVID